MEYIKNFQLYKDRVAITKINDRNSYVDLKNKLVFSFSARSGCTVAFQQFLDLVGLLEDAKNYSPIWIHHYRTNIIDRYANLIDVNLLKNENFIFIKFIMNAYRRCVSIYNIHHEKSNKKYLTFRQYLKLRLTNKDYFDIIDKGHQGQQYEKNEEKYITNYLIVNKNQKLDVKLENGEIYTIDITKYSSNHHFKKIESEELFMDKPLNEIINNMPKDYIKFYDQDIRDMVEKLYMFDINYYKFEFSDF